MPSELHRFLSHDHERLDDLLSRCVRSDGTIDMDVYEGFRSGLLRHIAIEEKVLFPELRKQQREAELVRQLHRDHAALAALLVPPPSQDEIGCIRAILEIHNEMEEAAGGLYEVVETMAGEELGSLMSKVHAIAPVRVAPHADTPIVRTSIEQLIREAEEGRRRMRGPGTR